MAPYALFARALIAYSVHEHQEGHVRRIDVWLRPGSFTVQDDGRGMGLDREGYAENLMGMLVGGEGAVQLHGVGLALIATSSPRLEVESVRGARLWRQAFAWELRRVCRRANQPATERERVSLSPWSLARKKLS